MNESGIIRTLQQAFASAPGTPGIGDDASILPLNDHASYVISKDILVENRHFRLTYHAAASLAHKALHVNLSDIAAMGAEPLFVLLGIALPPKLNQAWVEQFLSSFTSACKKQNLQLIGGDTTASENDLFISVTIIGRAKKTHLKFRHGAKPGNIICVVGALGEAHAGFIAIEKNMAGLDAVKSKFLCPNARNAEGLWLGAQPGVTAMMDLSDGLYVDLGNLIAASQAGATVDFETLQPTAQLTEACTTLKLDTRECMLAGGEDYALLLTINAASYEKTAQAFEKQFNYALTKIGTITTSNELQLRESGKPVAFAYRPFSHFGEL